MVSGQVVHRCHTTESGRPTLAADGGGSAEGLAGRVGRAAVWSGASTLFLRFSNIAVMAVVARIVAPRDFGVFAVALTVQAIVSSMGVLGVSSALPRGDLNPDEIAPTVATISLLSAGVLASAMAVFADQLATALGSPEAAGAIRVMSITVFLVGVFAVPGALLTRDFKQRSIFAATVIGFIPSSIVLVLMAADGNGALAFAWSRVVGQLLMGLTMTVLVSRRYAPGVSRAWIRPLLAFGLPLTGANLLNYVLLNADYVFISRLLGPTELGIYMLAFNVASWSTALLGSVINNVAMPAFSRLRGSPRLLGESLVKSTRGVALVAFPIAALSLVLSYALIDTVYGGKWVSAAPTLSILALYGALFVLCLLFANVLTGLGHTRLLFVTQLVWVLCLVPAMAVGIRLGGIEGAAMAHIAVITVVVFPVYLLAVRRSTQLETTALLRALLPPLAAAVLAAAVASACARTVAVAPAQLLLGGAVGASSYLVLVAPAVAPFVAGHGRSPGVISQVVNAYCWVARWPQVLGLGGRSRPAAHLADDARV